MKILCSALLLFINVLAYCQTNYTQDINAYRNKYKKDFLADEHSPLKTKKQLRYLDFYSPDIAYKVNAKFTPINDFVGFEMATHSKKIKRYYQYGKCEFYIKDTLCTLYLYQSKELMQKEELKEYLFMPFTDKTNDVSTYAGGRYIDFKISDIKNNSLEIDFNKAYNPYCMYADGYNCPIPPTENQLDIYIEAGEKIYKKAASN